MAEENTAESGALPLLTTDDLEELVRIFGLVFANTDLYGAQHGVTRKATDDCYFILAFLLDRCGDLTFSLSEEGMVVNGAVVEQKNPLMRSVALRMADLDISTFTLMKGLTKEHFQKLVAVMNVKGEELKASGGFVEAVLASGVENVKTRQVTYRAVTEDEVVVSKQVMDEGGGETSMEELVQFLGGAAAEGGPAEGGAAAAETKPAADSAASTAPERAARALQKFSDESPEKLSEAIFKAAEAGQGGAGGGDAQTLKDTTAMMVTCLKRVYDVLSKNPMLKNQKGKKNLARTLVTLEKQILARLESEGQKTGEDVQGKARTISEAIEGMQDEVEIEGLATEYMRKRRAIDTNERRILRFIKSKGMDKIGGTELREKLEEGGLTVEGWHDLLQRSGAAKPDSAVSAHGGSSEAHLSFLLTHLEDSFVMPAGGEAASAPVRSAEFTGAVVAVEDEIRDLVAKTEQKIDDLVKVIGEDEKAEAEQSPTVPVHGGEVRPLMTKRQMLILLAEIVQELCQPLAVIGCSIDMIKSKHLGDVTEPQLDMLNLAASSGERVKTLVDRILEISGLPRGLSPDSGIQASLYTKE